MAVKEILQLGNQILYDKSSAVDDVLDDEIEILITDLRDTLADFRNRNDFGRGIAAPQIGALKRVIYIHVPSGFNGAIINPEIVWVDDRRIDIWDSCFSFPNLMVRVSRAAEVRVEYTDELGRRKTLDAEGDLAELLQHEIDHLDGILAVQRAISPQAFATRQEWVRSGKL